MPKSQKTPLRALTAPEQQELARLAKARRARVDEVRRAQAHLAVAAGVPFTQAARTAGFKSNDGVAQLGARFNQHSLAALTIAPGRGCKPTYDATTRQRILDTARRYPPRAVDGTAIWSLHSLQQALRTAPDGFPTLSMTTIRRVLHEAGYSYQQSRTWCPTGYAQRVRKDAVVTVLAPVGSGPVQVDRPIGLSLLPGGAAGRWAGGRLMELWPRLPYPRRWLPHERRGPCPPHEPLLFARRLTGPQIRGRMASGGYRQ